MGSHVRSSNGSSSGRQSLKRLSRAIRGASKLAVVMALPILGFSTASASYVGASFAAVPGIAEGGSDRNFRGWLQIEAHYWAASEASAMSFRRNFRRLYYSGPSAPRNGESQLIVAISKRSPLLRKVMDACSKKFVFPQLTFAESADRARGLSELGGRPSDIPEYFEYRLKDVQLVDCPVVSEAPEQALVMSFKDIEWLNYAGPQEGREIKLEPASLPMLQSSGTTKVFVVTWYGQATDVAPDQCAAYNKPPSEDDYYALLPKEVADKERSERSKSGGVSYRDGTMERRGPNRLNAVKLPGIVKDPGQIEPVTDIARGVDLDGHDGRGRPPAGVCKHGNFRSADGRTGIDNQLYRVQGCSTGFQGHKGFLVQYSNEQRRNGTQQALILVSGIDNERNDERVDVTILYSNDPMAKAADGKWFLSDYTYRLTKNPELAHHFVTVPGRIDNGVLITKPVSQIRMLDFAGFQTFHDAQMRFEFSEDGSMKGVLGGYLDWRRILMMSGTSNTEYNHGLQIPAWYNAFSRYADGMKNPLTGECDGVSAAYDIEAVPAYLPPKQLQTLFSPSEATTEATLR